jgi:hypothetical protein
MFHGRFLRCAILSVQNGAILRNALRKRNYKSPSVSNDMQSSETMRNSLDLNYKSAALNQLSYAGIYESKSRKAKWQQLDVHSWRCLHKNSFGGEH